MSFWPYYIVKTRAPLGLSILLCLLALAGPGPAENAAEPSIQLTPENIQIGAFYRGVRLRIDGTVQAGAKAVVVIRGVELNEVFNWKERRWPLWINAGKVQVSGVPSVFLCFSPGAPASFLAREAIEAHQLDEAALTKQMRLEPAEMDIPGVRANFVALSTQEGRYRVVSDGVEMISAEGGRARYWADFPWPEKALPGMYEARVYECRDGAVIGQASVPVRVSEVGLPAELEFLSQKHGFIYGILAVVAAMLAGFGIDFLISHLRRKTGAAPAGEPASESGPAAH